MELLNDSLNATRLSFERTAREVTAFPETVTAEPVVNFELLTSQITATFKQGIDTTIKQFLPNLSLELEAHIKPAMKSLQRLSDEID